MYAHILVPLDGSALAEQVLPHVKQLNADRSALITLLRSVSRIPAHTIEWDRTAQSPLHELHAHEREAEAYLAARADELRGEGHRIATAVVDQNDPHEAILDYARANRVDIIAMATHGRGGIGRLIFGSVAERILHHSPVPMLVVRPRH